MSSKQTFSITLTGEYLSSSSSSTTTDSSSESTYTESTLTSSTGSIRTSYSNGSFRCDLDSCESYLDHPLDSVERDYLDSVEDYEEDSDWYPD